MLELDYIDVCVYTHIRVFGNSFIIFLEGVFGNSIDYFLRKKNN